MLIISAILKASPFASCEATSQVISQAQHDFGLSFFPMYALQCSLQILALRSTLSKHNIEEGFCHTNLYLPSVSSGELELVPHTPGIARKGENYHQCHRHWHHAFGIAGDRSDNGLDQLIIQGEAMSVLKSLITGGKSVDVQLGSSRLMAKLCSTPEAREQV